MLFEDVINLLEARPIPIDKTWFNTQAKRITLMLKRYLEAMDPEQMIDRTLVPGAVQTGVRLPNPKGEEVSVLIRLLAVTPKMRMDRRASQGGAFTHKRTGRHVLVLRFNGELMVDELLAAFKIVGKDNLTTRIRSTLIHELTHAIDPATAAASSNVHDDGSIEALKRYLNSPVEYAAHIQQIVDEITKRLRPRMLKVLYGGMNRQELFQELLKGSDTWKAKNKYFNPKNRKKALSTIYTAVERFLVGFPAA